MYFKKQKPLGNTFLQTKNFKNKKTSIKVEEGGSSTRCIYGDWFTAHRHRICWRSAQ